MWIVCKLKKMDANLSSLNSWNFNFLRQKLHHFEFSTKIKLNKQMKKATFLIPRKWLKPMSREGFEPPTPTLSR